MRNDHYFVSFYGEMLSTGFVRFTFSFAGALFQELTIQL